VQLQVLSLAVTYSRSYRQLAITATSFGNVVVIRARQVPVKRRAGGEKDGNRRQKHARSSNAGGDDGGVSSPCPPALTTDRSLGAIKALKAFLT